MKLRIGDKVRFLNEEGGGVITRFKDKDTAFVEIEDGFEVPYPVRFLIVTESELIVNRDAENLDLEPDIIPDESLYFVVEPDHELPLLVDEYTFYLFNQSSFNIYFTYSIKDGPLFQTIKHGELGSFQKLMLKRIKKKQLSEFVLHKIEVLFFKKSHYISQIPVAEVVKLNELIIKNVTFIRNEEFTHPVMYFVLRENFIKDTRQKIELTNYDLERLQHYKNLKDSTPQKSKPHKNFYDLTEKEVDLHIEELVENIQGMSAGEMLNLQIRRFQQELDNAITNNYRKIIFIHGVGNGRLKAEILNILKAYPELRVYDASYKKYGFGATEVVIRN